MKREHWASATGILKDESNAPQEDEQSADTTGPASGVSVQELEKKKRDGELYGEQLKVF